MAVFIPFGWYVLTSTGSMLAAGLIMGLGGQLMLLVLGSWGKWSKIGQELFWVIKRPMTSREIMVVLGIYSLFFGWFSLQLMGV